MAVSAPMTDAWTLQLENDARDGRLHDGTFLLAVPDSLGLAARSGVLPTYSSASEVLDLLVTPTDPTPSLGVRVAPGRCVINRTGLGPWVIYLDAPVTVTLDAGHASNPRVDVIVARIYDHDVGDPDTGPHGPWLDVVVGTPGPVPVVPTVPDGAIPLAQVTVGAGAEQIGAGSITMVRRSAWPRGGPRLLLDADDPNEPGACRGELRDRDGLIERWTGASWTILADLAGSPHGRYLAAASQPLAVTTYTALGYSVTQTSTPLVTRGGGNAQFTINRTGVWSIDAGVRLAAVSAGDGQNRFLRVSSGSGVVLASHYTMAGIGIGCPMSVSTHKRLTAGTVISAEVYQDYGSLSTSAPGTSEETHLALTWVGP